MTKAEAEWEAKVAELLDAARPEAPAPDAAFLERIMADAERVAAARDRPRRAPMRAQRSNWRRRLAYGLAPLGGWRGAAALAGCAAAGFWLGLAGPDAADMLFASSALAEPLGYPLVGAEDLLAGMTPAPGI